MSGSAQRRLLTPRQWITALATLLAVVGMLGTVIALSGVYSVSAARGHWPGVEWLLRVALERSVSFYSSFVEPGPMLDEAGRVRLGAAHYHSGCGACHGYPGSGALPVYENMLPAPPDLQEAMPNWSRDEAFWLVKNGLKYTGMPSWPGEGREDEVWSVVAFLLALPELDADEYRSLASGNLLSAEPDAAEPDAAEPARAEEARLVQTRCAQCHDTATAAPTSALVPSLGGQSTDYLMHSLKSYRSGDRESGIMEPIAAQLDDQQIAELSAAYGSLASPPHQSVAAAPELLAVGRELATDGNAAAAVPACDACHAPERLAAYPMLAGLPAEYQVAQLTFWRQGGRRQTALGRTMAVIAERLNDREIQAVSAYYASLVRSGGGSETAMASLGDEGEFQDGANNLAGGGASR